MRLPVADEDDMSFTLEPLDPETEAARQRMREAETPLSRRVVPPPESPRLQFSIRQVLIANAMLAVALALLQAVAPQLIAGALGLVAFGVFIGVHYYQPARGEPYAVSWGLIILYIVMASVALARA